MPMVYHMARLCSHYNPGLKYKHEITTMYNNIRTFNTVITVRGYEFIPPPPPFPASSARKSKTFHPNPPLYGEFHQNPAKHSRKTSTQSPPSGELYTWQKRKRIHIVVRNNIFNGYGNHKENRNRQLWWHPKQVDKVFNQIHTAFQTAGTHC